MEIALPPVVERGSFLSFLRKLPPPVLRAKGLVVLRDSPDKVHLFQRVEADEDVLFIPLKERSTISPLLILIGVKLPAAELRAQVANL